MDSNTGAALAGAVPVVGGVISSLLTNASNKDAAFENRETAMQMYNLQRRDALSDWDKQNAYNSPEAQMARYEKAGLNKNLIYGQSNISAPIRASSATVAERRPSDYSAIASGAAAGANAYIGAKAQAAQASNMEVMNTVALQNAAVNAAKAGAEIALMGKQGGLADTSSWKNLQETTNMKSLLPYQLSSMQQHTEREAAETNVLLNRDEREAAANSVNIKEAIQRITNMRIENTKVPYEIERLKADAAKLMSSTLIDNLDANLKQKGIQPHDSLFQRTVGALMGGQSIGNPGSILESITTPTRSRSIDQDNINRLLKNRK